MNQLICASLSHTTHYRYWYEVGMLCVTFGVLIASPIFLKYRSLLGVDVDRVQDVNPFLFVVCVFVFFFALIGAW